MALNLKEKALSHPDKNRAVTCQTEISVAERICFRALGPPRGFHGVFLAASRPLLDGYLRGISNFPLRRYYDTSSPMCQIRCRGKKRALPSPSTNVRIEG